MTKQLIEIRRDLGKMGYKVKTKKYSISDSIFAEVYKGDTFILGSGSNVTSKDHIKKHQKVFDYYWNVILKNEIEHKGVRVRF